jgi:hypothetical protein
MKKQKHFNLFTSLLMIATVVGVSGLCILISSNKDMQNRPANNVSDGITANDTSNDPVFYINQFEIDSLTIPGLGSTY